MVCAHPARVNLNELLALDDSSEALGLYIRLADAIGYRCNATDSFAKFKAAYLGSRPSLIILDVLIGAADCGEMLDFLARCRCVVPIILISGYSGDYMSQFEGRMKLAGLKLAGKVEKRSDMGHLEVLLRTLWIPEIEEPLAGQDETAAPGSRRVDEVARNQSAS